MRYRFHLFLLLLLAALLIATTLTHAQKVDLALVLLIDDSGSIDNMESQMQLRGYAEAFRNSEVLAAMVRGPHKAIAVSMVMFTDRVQVMIPWTRLDGPASARALADRMTNLPRIPGAATHIGKGIEFSINHLSRCPYEFLASTIDLSADGWDNEFTPITATGAAVLTGVLGALTGVPIGLPDIPDPIAAQRLSRLQNYASSRGITINAIAIEDPGLRDYFSRHVTAGPGAFTMFAPNFRAFTDSIQKKLLREINEAVKISTARQVRTQEVRKAQAVQSPPPKPRPKASPSPTTQVRSSPVPAQATGSAPPAEAQAEPDTGEAMAEPPVPLVVEARPPVERRVALMVRDAANDFPLDGAVLEAVEGTEILFQEEPEGRPGLLFLDLRTPAGQTPRLRVTVPLYQPKEVNLPAETNEVALERIPLRIAW